MKKGISALLAVMMLLSVIGCGSKKENSEEPATLGRKYAKVFLDSSDKDLTSLAKELSELKAIETEFVTMEVEEGYLAGFTEEITGFSKGVMFAPMIGAIPFVGYVFETDDTDALSDKLLKTSDPAWNVCTEADETVMEIKGNRVFFLMCPSENNENQ